MPSKGTARRAVRIEDGLWEAAREQADQCGDNLSDIIRQALRDYTRESSGNDRAAYQAEMFRAAREAAWQEGHQAGRLDEYCLDTNPYRSQA